MGFGRAGGVTDRVNTISVSDTDVTRASGSKKYALPPDAETNKAKRDKKSPSISKTDLQIIKIGRRQDGQIS